MYVNKCVKCGREFETKNPKRVICPDCLYPDKKMMINAPSEGGETVQQAAEQSAPQEQLGGYSTENQPQFYNSYSAGEERPRPQRQDVITKAADIIVRADITTAKADIKDAITKAADIIVKAATTIIVKAVSTEADLTTEDRNKADLTEADLITDAQ